MNRLKKASTIIFLFLSVAILLLGLSQFFSYNLADVKGDYSIAYVPVKHDNMGKLEDMMTKYVHPLETFKVKHNFILRVANLEKHKMIGRVVEKWSNGKRTRQCIGSTFFDKDVEMVLQYNGQNLITEEVTMDSSGTPSTQIALRSFMGMATDAGKELWGGDKILMDAPIGGKYKYPARRINKYEEDVLVPMLAYASSATDKEPLNLPVHEDLTIEEFIETQVKQHEGFVLYYQIGDSKEFLSPVSLNEGSVD